MRILLPIAGLFCVVGCTSPTVPTTSFRFPGEFEPQEAVWLGWGDSDDFHEMNLAMIRALMPHVHVRLAVGSDSARQESEHYLDSAHVDLTALEIHVIPGADFWMRDCAPAYVLQDTAMRAVDFTWADYGLRDWLVNLFDGDTLKADTMSASDGGPSRGTADSLCAIADRTPMIRSWLRLEGGAIESNGQGTLVVTGPLIMQRNPGRSKEEIEKEFENVLGIKHVIWLPTGLAEDPHLWRTIAPGYYGIGCGGHTDEYVRFSDPHTVLLAWLPEKDKDANPINRMNHERLVADLEVLTKAKDHDGKPLRIIKVPLPELHVRPTVMLDREHWNDGYNISVSAFSKHDGWAPGDTAMRVAAATYMNFFVTNKAVLIPTYPSADHTIEEEARRAFAEAFPGRELIFLDAMAANWDGGGLHCGTQQVPKRRR
ncbi:MAG: agmatine deiminase family protein [Flavobacteriales bacterium]|nr:agmatine deiminase family protein [Flavobacteriales bacterium]MCC6938519.1 agmatine deiminase family protein [Flavobacteriales bacterium]